MHGRPHTATAACGASAVVALATLCVNTRSSPTSSAACARPPTTSSAERPGPPHGPRQPAALHDRIDAIDLRASPRAVYVIDVDGFKFVNDSLGHHAGDRLLVLVAERLSATPASAISSPARAATSSSSWPTGSATMTGRSRSASASPTAAREPFNLDGEEVEVSVTIGVCRVADAATGEEALRDADLALYAAKLERRGTVKLFAARCATPPAAA